MSSNNTPLEQTAKTSEEQGVLWKQPLSGYEILDCISGKEEYGIFLARDTRLERDVIIKTMTADLKHHEDAIERFFNEARQVARIKHRNIARGLDVGRSGELFYFVMEFLRGESLETKLQRLQNGKLRELESLKIIENIISGLEHILQNGLIHHDLKPANIFLTTDATPKITDLGIAKDVAYATEKDRYLLAPYCISPEQAAGGLNIDIRSNLYAAGCIWYRMVLGAAPFNAEDPEIILKKHITDDPQSVCEVDPRITPATSQLINWLLAKDRNNRPKSPRHFLSKLMTHPLIKLKQEQELNDN